LSPLRLAERLATPHGVDSYLALIDPMLTVRRLRAEVTDVRRQTADTVTLVLRPTRQWEGFSAGQFIQLSVVIDGVRHTRCYSPACSEHRDDGLIEITVKVHTNGLVSRFLNEHAEPGLVVDLSPADGTFVLPPQRPRRIVLLSAGSGMTPVLSILRTLRDEGFTGDVAFLHYAGTEADVPYLDSLRRIAATSRNVSVQLAYTRQVSGGGLHGHFGPAHLDAVAPWAAVAQTYVCGPPALIASVRAHYDAVGLADRLHVEDFAPNVPTSIDGDVTGAVEFSRSGVIAANTGATLLQQAQAAGLTPAYGCRMGICYTCTSVKRSGCTRNALTGQVDAASDHEIQLCISIPEGDVVLDI
jgi:stearoyl-CoA 9-desaturase NADPH oxidoreductase